MLPDYRPMGVLTDRMLKLAIERAKKSINKMQERQITYKDQSVGKLRFKVLKVIGAGTFGLVAKIESEGEPMALKTVYEDKRYVNREVEILRSLQHPNIVNLIGFYMTDRSSSGVFRHICLEYVPRILEDVLGEDVGLDRIRSLYYQALLALSYLHENNVCHRDIKPANILVDDDWTLKICDFGTAKRLESNSDNVTYICSRYYRAPENILKYSLYTTKIDIWSLALVFLEFGTRQPFFKGLTSDKMLEKIFSTLQITSEALDLYGVEDKSKVQEGSLRVFLSAQFECQDLIDVIEKSLQFDFRERYSARELLEMPFFSSSRR